MRRKVNIYNENINLIDLIEIKSLALDHFCALN